MRSTIHVNLERLAGTIDRNLFGGFAEHLDHCIYGGIYDPDSPRAGRWGFRTDVLDALKRLRMPVIRYPGGNFVSGYRWRDGVGPKSERPHRLDLAWHTVDTNAFGTDEFITWCRTLGTEPYLVVNCGDGDMREARDWVEYCNGTENTALVRLRRKNGYADPHGVRYWGVGNEVDGDWQIGAKTPQEYARTFKEFGKVMKRVDPEIKLLAAATSAWDASFVERAHLLMEEAGDLVDYLSIHWYVGNPERDFLRYMGLSHLFETRLTAFEGLIHALRLAHSVEHEVAIAVDEWNVWFQGDEDRDPKGIYNLEDALVVAMQMNAFIRHAQSVKMANLAQIVNVIAPVVTWIDAVLLQTIFYPFELYSTMCGDQSLDLDWDGDTFDAGDRAARVLDVAGSLDTSDQRVVLFVVNRTENEETEAEIRLAAGRFEGEAQISVVNGPEIHSVNTFESPDTVGVSSKKVPVDGETWQHVFEPHSVTVLSCPVRR